MVDEREHDEQHEQGFEDFDAFWEQLGRKGKPLRLFGKVHHLPAAVPLEFELLGRRKSGSKSREDVERMLTILYGEGALQEWTSKGMDVEQLGVLLLWSIHNLRGRDVSLAEARELYQQLDSSGDEGDEGGEQSPKGKQSSGKRRTGGSSS